jgi:hypothetical protein
MYVFISAPSLSFNGHLVLPVVISVGGVLVIGAAVITVICVRKRRKETEDEIWATDILGRSVRP